MKQPKQIELTMEERTALIERIKNNALTAGDAEILTGIIDFNLWLQHSIQEKNISINKLKRAFGSNSEKRSKGKKNKSSKGNDKSASQKESPATDSNERTNIETENIEEVSLTSEPTTESCANTRQYVPNKGRLGHEAYTGAETIVIEAPYKPGDPCPNDLCDGVLRIISPGNVIKIVGESFAKAIRYEIETLRCSLCDEYFSSELPEHVCADKYDPAFKARLCVYRHFLGVPGNRLEAYQGMIGIPLPDSTQFDKIEDVANAAYPMFKRMEYLAANGELAHGDDTKIKIQSLIRENKSFADEVRKGLFTTGIISFYREHQIHLFYSGRKHCGENMLALLANRDPTLPEIKYMCDALPCNMPKNLKATLINCLIHSRRNFTDIDSFYPVECKVVIDIIAEIYKHDAEAREQKLTAEKRLQYHQTHSAKPMTQLHVWLQQQIDGHLVEPNSPLGKAIKYMLKHWDKLTQFLRITGAPLDNNVLERALKIPIRVRKNSLFYATEHGAYVGSIIQSIICTCIAASVNPVDYLTTLQVHKKEVHRSPDTWMPWNYKFTIASKADVIHAEAA